jgi:hypothetical protein
MPPEPCFRDVEGREPNPSRRQQLGHVRCIFPVVFSGEGVQRLRIAAPCGSSSAPE